MAGIIKHVAAAWVNAFAPADLNSLANGAVAIASLTIDNTTSLDIHARVSLAVGTISPLSNARVDLFLLPETHGAGVFTDGEAGATAANQPTITYLVASVALRTKASSTQNGLFNGGQAIAVPPGRWKFAILNASGVAFPASGNSCQYAAGGYNLNG